MEQHVKDAVVKGVRVVVGRHQIGKRFFVPTVLANTNATMSCATEETFGSFAPVFRFHTEQEAVDAANYTIFGLVGCSYSRDVGRF